jgi:hypothetical protein
MTSHAAQQRPSVLAGSGIVLAGPEHPYKLADYRLII